MPLWSEWSSSRRERAGRSERDIESAKYGQEGVMLFREGVFGDHLAVQVAVGLDLQ
jgi:hypothetical protein